ncbi:hypothetical protein T484DRAFT_1844694 [Baffinella frigidus]|nr:hypothetical protein T484DRAFT_1844694 [Cryptophyta sp. CCMP2293]
MLGMLPCPSCPSTVLALAPIGEGWAGDMEGGEMIAAVVRGSVAEVRGWIEDGGDVNMVEGKWGTTPLMAACAPTER